MTPARSRLALLAVSICILAALAPPDPAAAQLTTLANRVLAQGEGDIEGAAELDDRFGGSLAVGDFDGDGLDDLAVGADGESISGADGTGLVQVFYGSALGLNGARDQIFSQSTSGVPGSSEAGDGFGFALATLDVNCDGFDDLAIGAPFEDIGSLPFIAFDAGAIWILFGSATGLTGSGAVSFDGDDWPQDVGAETDDRLGFSLVGVSNGSNANPVRKFYAGAPRERVSAPDQEREGAIFGVTSFCDASGIVVADRLHQDASGVSGGCEPFDDFGTALGKGDFNGDGVDDLTVGVILEDLSEQDSGMMHVFYGSAAGSWSGADEESWHQDSTGILDQPDFAEEFGAVLASGDFDRDGFGDLVVGVAENTDGEQASGAAAVIYGGSAGLSEVGDQLWSQTGSMPGIAEFGDNFGSGLAVGDFDGDGTDDLAAGVVNDRVGSEDEAGTVQILYGVRFFGLDAPRNQSFSQNTDGLFTEVSEPEDHFGDALAAGDFNGDGRADLAIGVPGEDDHSVVDSGIVQILYGSDDGVLSELRFTTANVLAVVERTIVLVMNVERIGATLLPLSVEHRLAAGGSASLGLDFEYTSGTLSWAAGEAGVKPIIVRVLGDTLPEATEFARIELFLPTAGGATAAPSSRTLQITDDDTVVPTIFVDGFETGNSSRWSAVVP